MKTAAGKIAMDVRLLPGERHPLLKNLTDAQIVEKAKTVILARIGNEFGTERICTCLVPRAVLYVRLRVEDFKLETDVDACCDAFRDALQELLSPAKPNEPEPAEGEAEVETEGSEAPETAEREDKQPVH